VVRFWHACQIQCVWTYAKSKVAWVYTNVKPNTLERSSQPSPRLLGLAMCQAQNSVNLAHMLDPRCLDLVVSQVQDNYQGA